MVGISTAPPMAAVGSLAIGCTPGHFHHGSVPDVVLLLPESADHPVYRCAFRHFLYPHRELHTFCYSGRNLYGYYFFAIFDAFSSTNLTLVFNDLTFTITSRTCGTRLHSSQDRLLVADDRSASFAGRASLRTAVSFRPGSMAMRTRHIFFQLKFLFNSCRDFFQIQLYFHSEVRATEFSVENLRLQIRQSLRNHHRIRRRYGRQKYHRT